MMNKCSLLLIFLTLTIYYPSMAQKKYDYDAAWKKVEKYIDDNLPKSAKEEADKIYAQSKLDGADAQTIKALVYKSRMINLVEEDNWYKNVREFEKEITVAKQPARQLLHAVTADLYWNYFQNQRWKIYNRTNTVNFIKEDPETWGNEDFHRMIREHYLESLDNPVLLQQTRLEAYDPMILKGNQRKLRPALYDLLAHKAIDYFKTGEPEITKPSYRFELNDQASLAPYKIFLRNTYQSKDSSSSELIVIRLYQDLLRFHDKDNDKAALVNTDIERTQYAYSNSVNEYKEQLYKEGLEHIYSQYPQLPEALQAGYLLAQWWSEKGNEYDPVTGDEKGRYAFLQAATLCRELVKKFPQSEGGMNATNLLHQLELPSLSMEVEKVNTIDEPFRALTKFKNTGTIFLRVIALTEAIEKQLNNDNYNRDAYWTKLAALPYLKTWKQPLPSFTDLREHSAELKIDGLPMGKYIIVASGKNEFTTGDNVMSSVVCYVSNISYVNSNNEFFVLHRQSGKPLPNASVQVWETSYDYGTRRNNDKKAALLHTNINGYVKLPEDKIDRSVTTKIEISFQKDHLFISDDNFYYQNYRQNEEIKNKSDNELARYFIFTDRALYRPGQTIYFKAIGVLPHAAGNAQQRGNSLYLPGKPVTIELLNANNERVDTLQLIPNEFGSINGIFKLPGTGLTGRFTLKVNVPSYSTVNFSVEEYKRPKFYVEFENPRDSYKLNDTITVTGFAKAYAGNNIDGATVVYRVKRQTRFLYPWLFWKRGKMIWPPYNAEEMEITHGEVITGADGKFIIRFKAIPDLSTSKLLDPSFDYTIEADVTDLNGETRSNSNTVSVGYKSMIVNIEVPGGMNQILDSLENIRIHAINLAGETVAAEVSVKIFSLEPPSRLIRERYWEAPDTTIMNYEEFVKHFPHDEYREESDFKTWKKGKQVLTNRLSTPGQQEVKLSQNDFSAGYYVIEALTKDTAGNEIKDIEYFSVTDIKNIRLPAPVYNVSMPVHSTVEPGEKASFIQGSSASDIFIVQQTAKISPAFGDKPLPVFDFQSLDKSIALKSFETSEADRGGYSVKRFFVKDNRIYSADWFVNVPYTNKDLTISFETFRDKLLPGQQETWKVKISGYKKDAVTAELLASMYDASLDQFQPHNWQKMNIWNNNSFNNYWSGANNFLENASKDGVWKPFEYKQVRKEYDRLLTINEYSTIRRNLMGRAAGIQVEQMQMAAPAMELSDSSPLNEATVSKFAAPKIVKDEELKVEPSAGQPANNPVQIRKNFNETAFFYPTLYTNDKGEIEFSFTVPEALTQWKLQTLAYTKDLATTSATKTIVTQKQLMVQPNAPRFFRQGDSLILATKIVNLSDTLLTGNTELQLIDPSTMEPVNTGFNNKNSKQNFSIEKGQSIAVSFPFNIPQNYTGVLIYRIIAKAGMNSDGEEMALPVLTNRMLVTESFPINLRHTSSKQFRWEKLLQSAGSKTLQNQSLTIEYTSNPAWYAIQALPYLMEYPYDCAEQTWNRFYANALASKIANSMPKIKSVFEQWKNVDTAALVSNLQKNQELKAVLLEETPWVLQAKNEAEQKRNIALLFDMVRMGNEASKAIGKLQEMQGFNGGFVWFKGGPDDRYMTQYILTGIGHLKQLEAWPAAQNNQLNTIIQKALPYLDQRLKEDYEYLVRNKADLKKQHLSSITIQWLYMRSFFDAPVNSDAKTAFDYFTNQAKRFWTGQSKYDQGMIALALHRVKDATTPKAILKSLTENSISGEEFGMYWKEFNTGGYFWWQAPIESHSLLLEAYSEIENNPGRIDDLKTWLLKQKQTQDWGSTKATAEACYALLLQGSNWLNNEMNVSVQVGGKTIAPSTSEAGTGYFKQVIDGKDIVPSMGNIKVDLTKSTSQPINQSTSWGSVYWQYFEDLDKITPAATPMSLKKQLFIIKNSDNGPVITPLNDKNVLKVGDKLKVRIELRTDRNLEYVHLKDMRAACFEPVNVLSRYKYQDGLGYYESTRDASTNFFISYMQRGTYVFEYDIVVSHTGNFSNGISSIQCMYAPEFSSHSEGIRVTVK